MFTICKKTSLKLNAFRRVLCVCHFFDLSLRPKLRIVLQEGSSADSFSVCFVPFGWQKCMSGKIWEF